MKPIIHHIDEQERDEIRPYAVPRQVVDFMIVENPSVRIIMVFAKEITLNINNFFFNLFFNIR